MKRKRKITGKKYAKHRKKKAYEKIGQKRNVKIGEEIRKKKRVLGGNLKVFLVKAKVVNVKVKNNKIKKAEIEKVIETPSNRFLARQNILTKGTIVKTNIGNVKIINRPSQQGMVNGILIE